jgi:hypothetical protein
MMQRTESPASITSLFHSFSVVMNFMKFTSVLRRGASAREPGKSVAMADVTRATTEAALEWRWEARSLDRNV